MTWSCACVVFWAAIAGRSMESPLLAHPSGECAPLAQQSGESATVARASSARGDRAPVSDLEAEVVANLEQKHIPLATLADLDLPEQYLHRVAGRILRASFEENFRVVVSDATTSDARTADARGMHTSDAGASSATSRSARSTATEERPAIPSWLFFSMPAVLGALLLVGARLAKRREARGR
jgi:hypothetical protein